MTEEKILEALNFIGINPNLFNLEDSYFLRSYLATDRTHGKGHIYRVTKPS